SISRIPDPMPVVVKTILSERLQWRRPGPQIVMNGGRYGLRSGMANRAAPFVTQRASEIDVTDRAIVKALNGLDHTRIRTGLAAVLANATVLFHRAHQLSPFKRIVGARLFDVDVFAGLACPDAHKRMPMIRRGNRDGIDFLVLQQL